MLFFANVDWGETSVYYFSNPQQGWGQVRGFAMIGSYIGWVVCRMSVGCKFRPLPKVPRTAKTIPIITKFTNFGHNPS